MHFPSPVGFLWLFSVTLFSFDQLRQGEPLGANLARHLGRLFRQSLEVDSGHMSTENLKPIQPAFFKPHWWRIWWRCPVLSGKLVQEFFRCPVF